MFKWLNQALGVTEVLFVLDDDSFTLELTDGKVFFHIPMTRLVHAKAAHTNTPCIVLNTMKG